MAATVSKVVWIGRVLSGLVAFAFLMSAFMKLKGGDEIAQGMSHLGLPDALVKQLAMLEAACVALYVFPLTSVLGAVLLTGYLGGAICSHLRVGDPYYTQVLLGVAVWLALWLREERIRALLPLMVPGR